jgi:hypothetical protein
MKMSDLIFYTNDEETFRIPFPTPGTKCPETKLEIKMTEPTDEQIDELWDEIGGYYTLYPEVRNTIREALNRWGNVKIGRGIDTSKNNRRRIA